nr:hypothetical protein [Variovorax boronicumulans]
MCATCWPCWSTALPWAIGPIVPLFGEERFARLSLALCVPVLLGGEPALVACTPIPAQA